MLKKAIFLATFLAVLSTSSVRAQDTQTCTTVTQYGGAVSYICGAKAPIAPTGIADNLALMGSSFVGASAILAYFNRKIKRLA